MFPEVVDLYVLLTIDGLYYNGLLMTFTSHTAAWNYAMTHFAGQWFDIERI